MFGQFNLFLIVILNLNVQLILCLPSYHSMNGDSLDLTNKIREIGREGRNYGYPNQNYYSPDSSRNWGESPYGDDGGSWPGQYDGGQVNEPMGYNGYGGRPNSNYGNGGRYPNGGIYPNYQGNPQQNYEGGVGVPNSNYGDGLPNQNYPPGGSQIVPAQNREMNPKYQSQVPGQNGMPVSGQNYRDNPSYQNGQYNPNYQTELPSQNSGQNYQNGGSNYQTQVPNQYYQDQMPPQNYRGRVPNYQNNFPAGQRGQNSPDYQTEIPGQNYPSRGQNHGNGGMNPNYQTDMPNQDYGQAMPNQNYQDNLGPNYQNQGPVNNYGNGGQNMNPNYQQGAPNSNGYYPNGDNYSPQNSTPHQFDPQLGGTPGEPLGESIPKQKRKSPKKKKPAPISNVDDGQTTKKKNPSQSSDLLEFADPDDGKIIDIDSRIKGTGN